MNKITLSLLLALSPALSAAEQATPNQFIDVFAKFLVNIKASVKAMPKDFVLLVVFRLYLMQKTSVQWPGYQVKLCL